MTNHPGRQRLAALRLLLVGAGMLTAVSCGDDQSPGQADGTVLVGARTTGSDLDANGYVVSVNGGQGEVIGLLDTIYVTGLEPTAYVVTLSGIADNCSVPQGDNPQTATVIPSDTVAVLFDITCEPLDGGGGGLLTVP